MDWMCRIRGTHYSSYMRISLCNQADKVIYKYMEAKAERNGVN